jgi:hypothetical protein
MVFADREEGALLDKCAHEHPEEVWEEIAKRLAGQSWRVQLTVRGWLLNAFPPEVIEAWVGKDLKRARLIASIASPGRDEPTAIARFLLEKFGKDREVKSSLFGQFISGSWFGPMSEHIAGQIGQLTKWRQRTAEPLAVRAWAGEMIQHLEEQRRAALQREAEELF